MEFNRNGIGTVWVQFFSSSYDGLDPGWGGGGVYFVPQKLRQTYTVCRQLDQKNDTPWLYFVCFCCRHGL